MCVPPSYLNCIISLSYKLSSLLLIDFVASTASGHEVDKAMSRKEKTALPAPVRHQMRSLPYLH